MKSEGKYKVVKKDPLKAFYPIIGLIIMAIAAAVGWFSAPFVLDLGGDYIPREAIVSLTDMHPLAPQMVIAFMIFLIIVLLFSAIYAAFAPKQEKLVTEGVLKQERIAKEQDRKRTKARKRKMKSRMREGNKDLDDI